MLELGLASAAATLIAFALRYILGSRRNAGGVVILVGLAAYVGFVLWYAYAYTCPPGRECHGGLAAGVALPVFLAWLVGTLAGWASWRAVARATSPTE